MRILLVEDDEALAQAVGSYLRSKAFLIDSVPSLAQARACLYSNGKRGQQPLFPDAVLLAQRQQHGGLIAAAGADSEHLPHALWRFAP